MTEKQAPTKTSCGRCKCKTKHVVLFNETRTYHDDRWDYSSSDNYQIIECAGCESISFRHSSINSEDSDEEGQPFATVDLYPSPDVREPIKINVHLPFKVGNVYMESLVAMNNSAPILAAIGLRAVVEGI